MCEDAAPEIFRLDNEGELEVLQTDVSDEAIAPAQAAARLCPVTALLLKP